MKVKQINISMAVSMSMYKNILCALDLSDASKKVLERAVQVAKNNGAKLYLFHNAVKLSDIYSGVMNVDFSKTEEAGFQIATEQLERLNVGLYPNTEIIVDSGDFINNLTKVIKNKDIDLVIVGHNQDFWSKVSSSSKKVVDKIKVDTLVTII